MPQRDFDDVIKAVLAAIPETFEGKAALRQSLMALREDAAYAAPEAMGRFWEEAGSIIAEKLGVPPSGAPDDFRHQVAKIIRGE